MMEPGHSHADIEDCCKSWCCLAGHLLGFDKYMNMVLQNVEESYTVLLRIQRSKLVVLTEGPAAGASACPRFCACIVGQALHPKR